MLPSINQILNADNTQVGSQPRHPKSGTFQGMAHSAAWKGFWREQDAELADSSKGKGNDDPNAPAEEIEDEGEMIGQGDRPQEPRRSDGIPEGMPLGKRTFNAKRGRCPECGGEMVDGKCESCGYEEDDDDEPTDNADIPNAQAAGTSSSLQAAAEGGAVKFGASHGSLGRAVGRVASSVVHPIQTVKGQGSLLVHHPGVAIKAAARSVVHPIKHSDDYGIDKPEEHKATPLEAGQHAGHFGGEPMFESDTPHDQTLRAAGASMAHQPSRDHAMEAVDASMAGDSKRAAVMHRKSAREHLKEADQHMQDGNSEQAEAHLQAAQMHHRAAAHHMGCQMARNESTTTTKGVQTEVQPSKADQKPREKGNSTMAMNRKNVIDFIVVNCDCAPTGGPEATRNTLKQKSNEELLGLKSKLLGLITANAKAEGSFADTKGKGGKGVQVGGMGHGADDEVTYKEDEDDSTENEPEQAEDAFTGKNNTTANQRSGPMTRAEWMAAAPPEIREVVSNAEANDNREKLDLHRRITLVANNQHPQRKALILNELQGIKTKKGLQKLLGLVMPVEGITANEEEATQVYLGAGAPQAGITDNQAQDDILLSPTINWAEEHEAAREGKARRTTTVSSGR